MSVHVENEVGWIVDHQQEINKTYAMTHMFDEYRLCDFVSERHTVYQFRAVPELFTIRHTYMMDSQFTKSIKIHQISDNSDLVTESVSISDPAHEVTDKPVMSALRPATKSKVNNFSYDFSIFVFVLYKVYRQNGDKPKWRQPERRHLFRESNKIMLNTSSKRTLRGINCWLFLLSLLCYVLLSILVDLLKFYAVKINVQLC